MNDRYPEESSSPKASMYLLELAGEEAVFAGREAATIASDVAVLAPGLAVAGELDDERVRGLAYTRWASAALGWSGATVRDARRLLEAASIEREGTVAVRARDVRGRTGVDTRRAERDLGAVLAGAGFGIDLDAPDHELRAVFAAPAERPSSDDGGRFPESIIEAMASSEVVGERPDGTNAGGENGAREGSGAQGTEGICVLGWLVAESVRDFGERAPTEKPFFQPGSMEPLLARAIANIASAGPGRTIVDPMCGTGGLLVEAGLVGSRVIGIDAQRKMTGGARTNLEHYLGGRDDGRHGGGFAALQGDATRLPLRDDAADGVCFDVPYGRQSRIADDPDSLVSGALAEARRLAPRAVIVGDRPWTEAAREAGWEIESTFQRRVHRSLTRHIAVLDGA